MMTATGPKGKYEICTEPSWNSLAKWMGVGDEYPALTILIGIGDYGEKEPIEPLIADIMVAMGKAEPNIHTTLICIKAAVEKCGLPMIVEDVYPDDED